MTLKEIHQLPIGAHYFKAIDASPNSNKYLLGYSATKEEAIEIIKGLIKKEELAICEYEVINKGDKFRAKFVKFIEY